MSIRYFNDIETQKAYIGQINKDLITNKKEEKKLNLKQKIYRVLAKKSWYMPVAAAVTSLTMLGASAIATGPAMLTYPMQYLEIAGFVALMAGAGKLSNYRYKEIGNNLSGVESEIKYLESLKEIEKQKLKDLEKNKSVQLSVTNNPVEIKNTLTNACEEAYSKGYEEYENQQEPVKGKVLKLGKRK